ncbi:hypothetical protein H6P81_007725 [Aristolochia fimbriata]|uniref:Uncharacterized protein n=1 Tax=Aristolochia fimbriata TaxID=158543 RepID=A0AAV7F2B2_ARIFI|nr:hypothetical protein H6P81_007725 [Aristolochia fimbriata]
MTKLLPDSTLRPHNHFRKIKQKAKSDRACNWFALQLRRLPRDRLSGRMCNSTATDACRPSVVYMGVIAHAALDLLQNGVISEQIQPPMGDCPRTERACGRSPMYFPPGRPPYPDPDRPGPTRGEKPRSIPPPDPKF